MLFRSLFRLNLFKLNSLGEIIVSTLHNNTPIKKGEKVGATRVIPLIIDEEKIIAAESLIPSPTTKFEILVAASFS